MMNLPPWAEGPFELIVHGELHLRSGEDFDRRMALISFDNAIEVTIATYLSLKPVQRQNRIYSKIDVDKWKANYHTKLAFWQCECQLRNIDILIANSHIMWYHDLRNEQYHEGSPAAPNWNHLEMLRRASLWVFSELFDVMDVDSLLDQRVATMSQRRSLRQKRYDDIIDLAYGEYQLGGGTYSASELLHAADPDAYRELALDLLFSKRRSTSAA